MRWTDIVFIYLKFLFTRKCSYFLQKNINLGTLGLRLVVLFLTSTISTLENTRDHRDKVFLKHFASRIMPWITPYVEIHSQMHLRGSFSCKLKLNLFTKRKARRNIVLFESTAICLRKILWLVKTPSAMFLPSSSGVNNLTSHLFSSFHKVVVLQEHFDIPRFVSCWKLLQSQCRLLLNALKQKKRQNGRSEM